MKTIKTTWGKIFENSTLMLFNEYPNILNKLGEYDELSQFYNDDDYDDEIFQWYLVDEPTVDWLKRFCPDIFKDIHYSDTLNKYVLAVRHFGTGWDAVVEELEIKDDDVDMFYDSFKKAYHDDLPDWVKRNVFCEE